MPWNVQYHEMLMLMLDLWLQAETTDITHFGAYNRPQDGHFCYWYCCCYYQLYVIVIVVAIVRCVLLLFLLLLSGVCYCYCQVCLIIIVRCVVLPFADSEYRLFFWIFWIFLPSKIGFPAKFWWFSFFLLPKSDICGQN